MNRFDAIIIGTGQAGPSLADRLAKAGAAISTVHAILDRHGLVKRRRRSTGRRPFVPVRARGGASRAFHGTL